MFFNTHSNMGNHHGSGANRLAITAMARVCHFTRDELLLLQKEFQKVAKKKGKDHTNTVDRAGFEKALKLVKIKESDQEILGRLFTLFDHSGDGLINFKEFIVGTSAIVRGTLEEKLQFSFYLFDIDNSGLISPEEMKSVLVAMNNTVSYFGDDKLSNERIDKLVKEIFEMHDVNHDGELNFVEYMNAVATHPTLVAFVTHGATSTGEVATPDEKK